MQKALEERFEEDTAVINAYQDIGGGIGLGVEEERIYLIKMAAAVGVHIWFYVDQEFSYYQPVVACVHHGSNQRAQQGRWLLWD